MKNLFVLPTDKPSRLFVYDGKLGLAKESQYGSDAIQNQKIFITNEEKNKYGDWCIDLDSYFVSKFATVYKNKRVKKIILTTHNKLIEDGVQAIEDEFLDWFVNNPSCENVEIGKTSKLIDNYADKEEDKWEVKYHTYIPKEEFCENFTPKIGCLKDICSCNNNPKKAPFKHKVESLSKEEILANRSNAYEFINFDKIETLEEVKPPIGKFIIDNAVSIQGTDGAYYHYSEVCKLLRLQKEQDKNKYSEEKVDKLLDTLLNNNMCSVAGDELIEKFKNK